MSSHLAVDTAAHAAHEIQAAHAIQGVHALGAFRTAEGIRDSAAGTAAAWTDFALAEVGAAAALAGLLVVATSINISRIVRYPAMVARLAASLVLFAGVLFNGSLLLVPAQGHLPLGVEISVTGVVMTLLIVLGSRQARLEAQHRRTATRAAVLATAAALLVTLSGLTTATNAAGGLDWLVPGVLLSFAVGLLNAWVALVEILR